MGATAPTGPCCEDGDEVIVGAWVPAGVCRRGWTERQPADLTDAPTGPCCEDGDEVIVGAWVAGRGVQTRLDRKAAGGLD